MEPRESLAVATWEETWPSMHAWVVRAMGTTDLEGNPTPPSLAMLDCRYPLYAWH
jgi:hypothetical protein